MTLILITILILVFVLSLLIYVLYDYNNLAQQYTEINTAINKTKNNKKKEKFTDVVETSDIKTRLYTELPETLDDFNEIKNNIGYYRLSNGLEVILVHCPGETGDITVEAIINSGFITDPEGYDELNHLIEHLVFMKTKNFNSLLDMQKFIPLADYNGETGQTDVGLHWTMKSSTKDSTRDLIYLSRMLFVLKEMIYNAEFNHDRFEAEKNIVTREYDIANSNVDNNHSDNMGKEIYKTSDFKKIYGTNPENIAKITPEIVAEYYRKFYKPDNMRVFIYGNLPKWPIDVESSKEGNNVDDGKTTTTKQQSIITKIHQESLINFYGKLLKSYFVDNTDEVIKMDDLYSELVADPVDYPSATNTGPNTSTQIQQLGYEYTFDIATIQEWLKQLQARLFAKNPVPTIEYITTGPVEKQFDDLKITQSKLYALFRHPKFKNKELANVDFIITEILYDKLFRVLRNETGLVYSVDISNNTIFFDYINESYVISCITGATDVDNLKSILLAEIGKIHQGEYITLKEYLKYQSKAASDSESKTDCGWLLSDIGNYLGSIRSDFNLPNIKFYNNLYDKISLDTLNQIIAFIFDPKVCEIFIFTNPNSVNLGNNPSATITANS